MPVSLAFNKVNTYGVTWMDLLFLGVNHGYTLPAGQVRMNNWNIITINHEGNMIEKFLGYDVTDRNYRISPQILSYDAENNTGKTASGSSYEFLEPPGKLHSSAQRMYNLLDAEDFVSVSLKFNNESARKA